MIKTPVTVRVIAKGGKFLADDISGALVTIRHAETGELLVSGRTQGNSGDLLAVMIEPRPRTVPIPAGPTVSNFTAEIVTADTAPIPLLITAKGPGGGLQSTATTSTTQWIVPGLTTTSSASSTSSTQVPATFSCLLELPGLIVQALAPATHTSVKEPQTVDFSVNVAMMCGCPIDDGFDPDGPYTIPNPWRVKDFFVGVIIRCADQPDEQVTLDFDLKAKAPGRFTGSWTMTKPGFYTCDIVAYQLSTGNTGTATVSVFCLPPAPPSPSVPSSENLSSLALPAPSANPQ